MSTRRSVSSPSQAENLPVKEGIKSSASKNKANSRHYPVDGEKQVKGSTLLAPPADSSLAGQQQNDRPLKKPRVPRAARFTAIRKNNNNEYPRTSVGQVGGRSKMSYNREGGKGRECYIRVPTLEAVQALKEGFVPADLADELPLQFLQSMCMFLPIEYVSDLIQMSVVQHPQTSLKYANAGASIRLEKPLSLQIDDDGLALYLEDMMSQGSLCNYLAERGPNLGLCLIMWLDIVYQGVYNLTEGATSFMGLSRMVEVLSLHADCPPLSIGILNFKFLAVLWGMLYLAKPAPSRFRVCSALLTLSPVSGVQSVLGHLADMGYPLSQNKDLDNKLSYRAHQYSLGRAAQNLFDLRFDSESSLARPTNINTRLDALAVVYEWIAWTVDLALPGSRAILFGSSASGFATEDSDLDIVIMVSAKAKEGIKENIEDWKMNRSGIQAVGNIPPGLNMCPFPALRYSWNKQNDFRPMFTSWPQDDELMLELWASRKVAWLCKRLFGWDVRCVENAMVPVVKIKAAVRSDGLPIRISPEFCGPSWAKYMGKKLKRQKRTAASSEKKDSNNQDPNSDDETRAAKISDMEIIRSPEDIGSAYAMCNMAYMDKALSSDVLDFDQPLLFTHFAMSSTPKPLETAPGDNPDKIWTVESDLSMNRVMGVYNTRLLRGYASCNKLTYDLGLIIKLWSKKRQISGSADGYLSGYHWLLLMIHYLQRFMFYNSADSETPDLPFLPCLQDKRIIEYFRQATALPCQEVSVYHHSDGEHFDATFFAPGIGPNQVLADSWPAAANPDAIWPEDKYTFSQGLAYAYACLSAPTHATKGGENPPYLSCLSPNLQSLVDRPQSLNEWLEISKNVFTHLTNAAKIRPSSLSARDDPSNTAFAPMPFSSTDPSRDLITNDDLLLKHAKRNSPKKGRAGTQRPAESVFKTSLSVLLAGFFQYFSCQFNFFTKIASINRDFCLPCQTKKEYFRTAVYTPYVLDRHSLLPRSDTGSAIANGSEPPDVESDEPVAPPGEVNENEIDEVIADVGKSRQGRGDGLMQLRARHATCIRDPFERLRVIGPLMKKQTDICRELLRGLRELVTAHTNRTKNADEELINGRAISNQWHDIYVNLEWVLFECILPTLGRKDVLFDPFRDYAKVILNAIRRTLEGDWRDSRGLEPYYRKLQGMVVGVIPFVPQSLPQAFLTNGQKYFVRVVRNQGHGSILKDLRPVNEDGTFIHKPKHTITQSQTETVEENKECVVENFEIRATKMQLPDQHNLSSASEEAFLASDSPGNPEIAVKSGLNNLVENFEGSGWDQQDCAAMQPLKQDDINKANNNNAEKCGNQTGSSGIIKYSVAFMFSLRNIGATRSQDAALLLEERANVALNRFLPSPQDTPPGRYSPSNEDNGAAQASIQAVEKCLGDTFKKLTDEDKKIVSKARKAGSAILQKLSNQPDIRHRSNNFLNADTYDNNCGKHTDGNHPAPWDSNRGWNDEAEPSRINSNSSCNKNNNKGSVQNNKTHIRSNHAPAWAENDHVPLNSKAVKSWKTTGAGGKASRQTIQEYDDDQWDAVDETTCCGNFNADGQFVVEVSKPVSSPRNLEARVADNNYTSRNRDLKEPEQRSSRGASPLKISNDSNRGRWESVDSSRGGMENGNSALTLEDVMDRLNITRTSESRFLPHLLPSSRRADDSSFSSEDQHSRWDADGFNRQLHPGMPLRPVNVNLEEMREDIYHPVGLQRHIPQYDGSVHGHDLLNSDRSISDRDHDFLGHSLRPEYEHVIHHSDRYSVSSQMSNHITAPPNYSHRGQHHGLLATAGLTYGEKYPRGTSALDPSVQVPPLYHNINNNNNNNKPPVYTDLAHIFPPGTNVGRSAPFNIDTPPQMFPPAIPFRDYHGDCNLPPEVNARPQDSDPRRVAQMNDFLHPESRSPVMQSPLQECSFMPPGLRDDDVAVSPTAGVGHGEIYLNRGFDFGRFNHLHQTRQELSKPSNSSPQSASPSSSPHQSVSDLLSELKKSGTDSNQSGIQQNRTSVGDLQSISSALAPSVSHFFNAFMSKSPEECQKSQHEVIRELEEDRRQRLRAKQDAGMRQIVPPALLESNFPPLSR